MSTLPDKILFYDGDCGFCNRSVAFVLKHDGSKSIHFTSLQSGFTAELFKSNGWEMPDLSTLYYLEGGILYDKSNAAFRVMKQFAWYKRWPLIFRVIPRAFRDWVYDQIAKRRRRISKGFCVVPKMEDRSRFIDNQSST